MSTKTTDLTIPPVAAEAWFTCGCDQECGRAGYQHEALGPIVAAELRRLAEEIRAGCTEYIRDGASEVKRIEAGERVLVAMKLHQRADVLDPSA